MPIAIVLLGMILVIQVVQTPDTQVNPGVTSGSAFEAGEHEGVFGAEPNPTGNPIGGGEGYGNGITSMDSQVTHPVIATQSELIAALESAKSGDVLYIDADAQINLTETAPLVIPAGVTLASNRGERNTTGSAVYSFIIEESGDYTLWGLVATADGNHSSFWVQMDDEVSQQWNLEPGSDWYWSEGGTYNLSAGRHTLIVQWREDGSKLDRVLVTDESDHLQGIAPKEEIGGEQIGIEAESGELSSPMRTEYDATASGGAYIMVPKGSGTGEPPVSPGGKILLGKTDANHAIGLFAGGEHVRITGLRIEGPDTEIEGMGHPISGIYSAYQNLEVDNCEISGWSGAAIQIYRTGGVSDMKTGGYIHHNYIHHCQWSGRGYGVEVGQGGVCLVEANRFDHCRHAIAGTGDVNNGYEVRYNLFGPNFPASNSAHVVDMHGVSTPSGNVAGDRLNIHHNTFEAISTTDYSIAIRGIPGTGAYIDHNWIKYTGAPIGRTGVTSSQLNTRMYIGENKGPSGQILTTLQQRIISTSLA